MQWFDYTHQLAAGFGTAYWLRTALPRDVLEDAWLMQALDVLKTVHDQLLAESHARSKHTSALKKWRDSRGKRTATGGE